MNGIQQQPLAVQAFLVMPGCPAHVQISVRLEIALLTGLPLPHLCLVY